MQYVRDLFSIGKGVLRQAADRAFAPGQWAALPTADIDFRGALARTEGGTGVNDALRFAEKDTADTYRWALVPTLPTDPGADRIAFWDESDNAFRYLTASTGLTLSGTSLTTTAGMALIGVPLTFSGAGSASFPANTFTATYRQYLVVMRATLSANANLTWRLRAAGSDDSNSTYFSAGAGFVSAAPSSQNNGVTAQSTGFLQSAIGTTNGEFFTRLLIDAPQVAERTEWEFYSTARATTPSTIVNFGGGHFNNTTAFDALTLIPASGTITGTAWCYGLTGV